MQFHTLRDAHHPYQRFRYDVHEAQIVRDISTLFTAGDDKLNHLLLESRILELLALTISHLSGATDDLGTSSCSKDDRMRIQHARDILIERLDNPPTLHELSRLIQMNDCKMKRLFKQIHGQTAYQFVRTQRLEHAHHLLTAGDCNVSQAACQIGYTNVSHFSDAFRKQFGIQPSTLIHTK